MSAHQFQTILRILAHELYRARPALSPFLRFTPDPMTLPLDTRLLDEPKGLTRQQRFAYLVARSGKTHAEVAKRSDCSASTVNNYVTNTLDDHHKQKDITSRPIKFKTFESFCLSLGLSRSDANYLFNGGFDTENDLSSWLDDRVNHEVNAEREADDAFLRTNELCFRAEWRAIIPEALRVELEKQSKLGAPGLLGRDTLLERLERHLLDPIRKAVVAYLEGPMGVGKTAIAASLLLTLKPALEGQARQFPGVFCFDCKADPDADLMRHAIFDAIYLPTPKLSPRRLREVMNEAITIGLKRRPTIIIFDNFEAVQNTHKTDPDDIGRAKRPFPDFIGRLTEPTNNAKIIICSQVEWAELNATCGRMACAHTRVNVLPLEIGAQLFERTLAEKKVEVDHTVAQNVSKKSDGNPLQILCAAAAVESGEAVEALIGDGPSALWERGNQHLERFISRQSVPSRAVLRLLALASTGLPRSVLGKLMDAMKSSFNLPNDTGDAIEIAIWSNTGLIEEAPILGVPGATEVLLSPQVKDLLRYDWETGSNAAVARRAHRFLSQYYLQVACAERGIKLKRPKSSIWGDGVFGLYRGAFNDVSAKIRSVKLFQHCIVHALASVLAPTDDSRQVAPPESLLKIEEGMAALHQDASPRLVTQFAYSVLYLQCIEQNEPHGATSWFLSRTIGANDEKSQILCRFLLPGTSLVDVAAILNNKTLLPPYLFRKDQASVLRSLGISSYGLNFSALAGRALEHAQSQYLQLGDFLGAARVLKTRIDVSVALGLLSQAKSQAGDFIEIVLGKDWDCGDVVDLVSRLDLGDMKSVAQLLGRYGYCVFLTEADTARSLTFFEAAEQAIGWLAMQHIGMLDGNVGRKYLRVLLRLGKIEEAKFRCEKTLVELDRKKDLADQVRLAAKIDLVSILRARKDKEAVSIISQIVGREAELASNLSASFEAYVELLRCHVTFGRGRRISIKGELVDYTEVINRQIARARRRGARLYLCDLHLVAAELATSKEREEHLVAARGIVNECGYKLREADLSLLAAGQMPSKIFGA